MTSADYLSWMRWVELAHPYGFGWREDDYSLPTEEDIRSAISFCGRDEIAQALESIPPGKLHTMISTIIGEEA